MSLWTRFGDWRRSRPFWAGLLVMIGGVFVIGFPLTFVARDIVTAGVSIGTFDRMLGIRMAMSPFGYINGALLLVIGALIWARPTARVPIGFAAVIAGLVAFVLGHLGGFVVGTLASILGGSMALAWTTEQGTN